MIFSKNSTLFLLFALLLGNSFIALAQEPKKTIIDFSKSGKTTKVADTDSDSPKPLEKQNAIFIDLGSAPSGFVTLGYERAITSQVSVELTGGVTFLSLTGEITNTIERLFAPNEYAGNTTYWADKGYSIEKTTATEGRTQKLGTYLSTSAKFFLEDEVFDGFFVSPRIQYINYNFQAGKPFAGIVPSGSYDAPKTNEAVLVSKNYLDVIPSIGWNAGGDRIVWSYEFGVGARFVNVKDYDSGSIGNANGSRTYEVRSYENNYIVPMFSSVLRMGIKF